jgi:D-alanine-D-alanine ligase
MNHLIAEKTLKKPRYPVVPLKVAVLMGGWSPERAVSLTSGRGVCGALQALGHQVFPVDPERDLEWLAKQLKTCAAGGKPDVVFNILHGPPGENGVIQGVLELLELPYTFSGVLASALAMDKGKSRAIATTAGLRCPQGMILSKQAYQDAGVSFFPHVVKPLQEGSTVGVTWVGTPQDQQTALSGWAFGEDVLVERYIPGREIQVAVLNGKALGAVEIRFDGPIFSYEAKYTSGKAIHLVPAPMDPVSYEGVLEMAETIHQALGCKGATRSDFRYDDTQGEPGVLYYLETNTQPGMTPLSLVPEIAAYFGWSYEDLVQWILEDGLCRN